MPKIVKITQGRDVLTAEEEECINLRGAGYTYQQIAVTIGRSKITVQRFFKRKQAEYRSYIGKKYVELMDTVLDTVNAVQRANLDAAKRGNIRSGQLVLDCVQKRLVIYGATQAYLQEQERKKQEKKESATKGFLISLETYPTPEEWETRKEESASETV